MRATFAFMAIIIPSMIALILGCEDILWFTTLGNLTLMTILLLLLMNKKQGKTTFGIVCLYLCVISSFSVLSYYSSITVGSQLEPYIPGGDGEKYFYQAKLLSAGNPLDAPKIIRLNYLGYQVLLGFWFKWFGAKLFHGLFLNYSVLNIALVLLAVTTQRFYSKLQILKTAYTIAIFVTPFTYMGALLLKDVMILFAMILSMYVLVRFYFESNNLLLILLIIPTIILGTMRIPYLVIIPIIFLLIGNLWTTRKIILMSIIATAAVVVIPILMQFTVNTFGSEELAGVVLKTTFVQESLNEETSQAGVVKALINNYTDRPLWYRITFLPIPLLIQYVTPFNFWSTEFVSIHFYFFVSRNLNVIWFGFLGVLFIYTFLNNRSLSNGEVKKLFLLGVVFYAAIAFIYGGTVPRYAAPSIVFMLPGVAKLVHDYRNNSATRNRVKKFFTAYYGLCVILVFCYISFKLIR